MGYWDLNPQPLEHESPLITTIPVFPLMLTKMLKQKLMWLLFVFFWKNWATFYSNIRCI